MKRFFLIVIITMSYSLLFAHSKNKIDPYTYDYFSHKYQYLDTNFSINIDNQTFQNAIKKFGFYSERIRKYSDSLQLIMRLEFENYDKGYVMARVASLRIGFDWERLSYYIWMPQSDVEKVALTLKISHPYKLYEAFKDELNQDFYIQQILGDLKTKLSRVYPQPEELEKMSRKELLRIALVNSPQRIADYEKMLAERRELERQYQLRHGAVDPAKVGVECQEDNCCQKQ